MDLSAVYEQLARLDDGPRLVRVEVGWLALAAIHSVFLAQSRVPDLPPADAPLGTMFGVPLVVRSDFAPGQWRMLASDGSRMDEGDIARALAESMMRGRNGSR